MIYQAEKPEDVVFAHKAHAEKLVRKSKGHRRWESLYGLSTVAVGLFEGLVCYEIAGGELSFLGFWPGRGKRLE